MEITKEELDYLKNDYDIVKYTTAKRDAIKRIYDICNLSLEHRIAVMGLLGEVTCDYILREAIK